MGTNFYIHEPLKDVRRHIGKRSAAGLFCWDCHNTLCMNGPSDIHYGVSTWHPVCPICGTEPTKEALSESSAGTELGFNKNPLIRQGVRGCSSFTFAMDVLLLMPSQVIVNEYGDKYSFHQFFEMLKNCPIRFYHLIGKEFS